MRETETYIQDIRGNFRDILQFVEGLNFDSFAKDKKMQNAVIRSFEVVGESAKNITPEVQEQYSNISWRVLAGFRDRPIHAYFDVNLEIVWESVQQISDLSLKLERV